MIRYIRGDIFKSKAAALVNPVNCAGRMGAGLAQDFAIRFPEIINLYRTACDEEALVPGEVQMLRTESGIYIFNFPTKDHWKNPSQISYIREGLYALAKLLDAHKIKTVALPLLGCGLGGLKWEDVKPLVIEVFEDYSDIDVKVYKYGG